MKKLIIGLMLTLSLALVGCGNGNDEKTITVGASPEPHSKILEQVKDDLKNEGYELKIKDYSDYVQPNLAVENGEIDANFFQHEPYLENFIKERGSELISVGKIHIEPMGLYSKKIKSLDELQKGAKISIPNDATNGGRALLLLEKNNLIKLDEKAGYNATEKDIVENPKEIKIQALEAAQLSRTLDDVDASVINGNYALEADFNPVKDAIILEEKNSPYANVLVVKKGNENQEKIKALVKALQSDKVKKYIEDNYDGGVIPSF